MTLAWRLACVWLLCAEDTGRSLPANGASCPHLPHHVKPLLQNPFSNISQEASSLCAAFLLLLFYCGVFRRPSRVDF